MNNNETVRRIVKALADGWSWAEIGQKVGLSAAAAEARYSAQAAAMATPVSTWKSAAYRED